MKAKGMAVFEAGEELKEHEYEEDLGEDDVLVKISHCGICHSDVHLIDNDWGMSEFPFVPGHEIIGEVEEVGKNVSGLKKGQRVGVGWQSDSCDSCEWCQVGEENLCPTQEATAVGRNGGFADKVIANNRFVIPIPEELSSEGAAPMLCGGITVYSPLRMVNSNEKVGVIGVGGLGHFAIQFAAAKGCEVTAFSTSPEKEKEAKKMGAHNFVTMDNLDDVKNSLDVIINTSPVSLEWENVMAALRPYGTLVQVGAAPDPIEVNAFTLITGRKAVRGSNIGSPAAIREMLEFAALHGIEAVTENYKLEDVNDAVEKVRKGDAKYRVVLEV